MSSIQTIESDTLNQAIQIAQANGITVVSSAGNNGKQAKYYTPGNIEGVYTIGACDANGERNKKSNYGECSTSIASAKFSAYYLVDINNEEIFLL